MLLLSRSRGQSLVEFLVLLPILMLLIVAILQDFALQDRAQKANMAQWYLLRGATYDWINQGPSTDDLIDDAAHTFFLPGDDVQIHLYDFVSTKDDNTPKDPLNDPTHKFPVLGMGLFVFDILNLLDVSVLRQVDVSVTFKNPFPIDLGIPLAGGPFGKLVHQGKTISASARGYIWASWTSIAQDPGKYVDNANHAYHGGGGGDAKAAFEKNMEKQRQNYCSDESNRSAKQAEADGYRAKANAAKKDSDKAYWNGRADDAQGEADKALAARNQDQKSYDSAKSSCERLYGTCGPTLAC